MVKDITVPMRRDAASHKARIAQQQLKLIEYRIEGNDAEITSGVFQGRWVKEMFFAGTIERDYIVKNLCVRNDTKLLEIIGGLCGR